jgi:hypothetical protein
MSSFLLRPACKPCVIIPQLSWLYAGRIITAVKARIDGVTMLRLHRGQIAYSKRSKSSETDAGKSACETLYQRCGPGSCKWRWRSKIFAAFYYPWCHVSYPKVSSRSDKIDFWGRHLDPIDVTLIGCKIDVARFQQNFGRWYLRHRVVNLCTNFGPSLQFTGAAWESWKTLTPWAVTWVTRRCADLDFNFVG